MHRVPTKERVRSRCILQVLLNDVKSYDLWNIISSPSPDKLSYTSVLAGSRTWRRQDSAFLQPYAHHKNFRTEGEPNWWGIKFTPRNLHLRVKVVNSSIGCLFDWLAVSEDGTERSIFLLQGSDWENICQRTCEFLVSVNDNLLAFFCGTPLNSYRLL